MKHQRQWLSQNALFRCAPKGAVIYLGIPGKTATSAAFKEKRMIRTEELLAVCPRSKTLVPLVKVTFLDKPQP